MMIANATTENDWQITSYMSLGEGGWGGLKYPLPPYEIFLKGYPPPTWNFASQNFRKKMAFLKKFLTFLTIFSENFGDLSGLSQICNKIFKIFLTPPPLKIFLYPYPPPTIFGQAHVWITLESNWSIKHAMALKKANSGIISLWY